MKSHPDRCCPCHKHPLLSQPHPSGSGGRGSISTGKPAPNAAGRWNRRGNGCVPDYSALSSHPSVCSIVVETPDPFPNKLSPVFKFDASKLLDRTKGRRSSSESQAYNEDARTARNPCSPFFVAVDEANLLYLFGSTEWKGV